MIDPRFVSILRCPVSREPLSLLPKDRLDEVNRRIAGSGLRHADGREIDEPLEAGLVTADGGRVYPVREGIPILLADEAIPVAGD